MTVSVCSFSSDRFEDIENNASAIFKAFTKNNSIDAADIDVDATIANAVQDYYIALLRPTWGMDVGYASYSMVNDKTRAPVPTAILLENMFTGTRAVISRSFGVQMHAAAEILVRVGSDDLNHASSRRQALASLKSVIPSVRLSDNLVQNSTDSSDSLIRATNLNFRFCVMGAEIELTNNDSEIDSLAEFSVTMLDQDKNEIAFSSAHKHPHILDAVLQTKDALQLRGIKLLPGDILALGPLTESHAVEDLSRLRAVFEGLDENQDVFVYMGFQ